MAISFVPLPYEIEFDSLFIKRSSEALTEDLLFLFERLNIRVSLAAVFIEGRNPTIFRDLLQKICETLPIHFSEYSLSENTDLDEVIVLIKSLNRANDINGLIIELPFSLDSRSKQLFNLIDPVKDVRLNNADHLIIKQRVYTPNEEEILSILMMIEKAVEATVKQIPERRRNP